MNMEMKYSIETPKVLQDKCDEIWDDVCRTWDDTERCRFEKKEFTDILEAMDGVRDLIDESVETTNDVSFKMEKLKDELEKELIDVRQKRRF
jgi:hypothetical protein